MNQLVLMFKELYALEKIHGTSANVKQKGLSAPLTFSSGGAAHQAFLNIFDVEDIQARFNTFGQDDVEIYGEAYGGKMQKMSHIYGPDLKFVAFEVKIHEMVLNVPDAHEVANKLGFEFVDYKKIPAILEAINAERDRNSVQAIRNGMGEGKSREGIVLRPIEELITKTGNYVLVKHKSDVFKETATPRKVEDPAKLKIMADADVVAFEFVTDMRLLHILDKIPGDHDIKITGKVIQAMIEDILREGRKEVIDSKVVRKAIGNKTRKLFHDKIKNVF